MNVIKVTHNFLSERILPWNSTF